MTGWVILAVYCVGYIAAFPRAYNGLLSDGFDSASSDPSTEDRIGAAAFGAFLTLFWPLAVAFYPLYRWARHSSPHEKAIKARHREWDLDEREREIKRMERELQIKRDQP